MLVPGHLETGNPMDVTQQDSTSPQRTYLIGICKDMMSGMDPLREAGLQDGVAGTSLFTRKFSSSIFCWKALHKFQEGESKNTKCKSWLQITGASGIAFHPPFTATWGSTRGQPVIIQWQHSNADSLNSEIPCEQTVKR